MKLGALYRVPAPETPRDELVQKLSDAFDTAHAKCKALISRQDDIVRGLGGIQKLLKLGAGDAALTAINELLTHDLQQSKDRTYNQDAALRIAIRIMQENLPDHGTCERFKCNHADARAVTNGLEQIKMLAPEAFDAPEPDPAVQS